MVARRLGLASLILAAAILAACNANHQRWAVCYSCSEADRAFDAYDVLVFDSYHHPDLAPLQSQGKIVLGYLSLGQLASHRRDFVDVRRQNLLLWEAPNWNGSFIVDVRMPGWRRHVLEQQIPKILDAGFDGVMLDTLDTVLHLESADPVVHAGMRDAAVDLVKAIREEFPDIQIMLNRSYAILPDVAGDVTMVLGESMYTRYDFEQRRYVAESQVEYERQVAILKRARQRNPSLVVLTLDYWYPDDRKFVRTIYRAQRSHGFIPYVATIELDRIVREQ